jgi:hypothetical protein
VFLAHSTICSQHQLAHLLVQIERGRCSHVERAQDIALNTIEHTPNLPLQEFNAALNILLHPLGEQGARFPALRSNIDAIDLAINYFIGIPGFQKIIAACIRTMCSSTQHTALWQMIKAAMDIEESDSTETVISFGTPADYQGPALAHNNHIITNKQWIEFKTVHWNSSDFERGKKARNLRRCILHQKYIVGQYNNIHGTRLTYALLCTQPVSPRWHAWLTARRITYKVM